MFDRTYLSGDRTSPIKHSHHATVTENRAPTDDSVKLLGDMQEQARKSIVLMGRMTTHIGEVAVSVFRDDASGPGAWKMYMRLLMQDGTQAEVHHVVDNTRAMRDPNFRLGETLMRETFQLLVTEVLATLVDDAIAKSPATLAALNART